uniref:GTPase-activating protein and VPS9 domain-containing protein 1 n=1 Tax=Denticeps clupeoides TaxID=299321 RepID=A0AAY4ET27_9TELE
MVKPDIHTLAHHLKQERLYVSLEKQLIQRLNGDVLKTAEKLYRAAWIAKQQRINLDRLILTSAEASPAECCQHARLLEDAQFVDGYKTLGFQDSIYGEFLCRLRENPRLVASCLVAGERLNHEHTQSVIHTVFTSLYGNCIMQEDESYLLQVLRYLMEFELKESDNPRRLLRRGTCAFSILFKLFSEGLYTAKLFLTATLHEPIMQLLVEDEDHLETDPAKLTERFTQAQQERLFGEKGSEGYRQKVQAAVEANEAKLVALVNSFITCLRQNTYCFPQSLRWIVSQMYKTLERVERLEVGEVRTMCTDLLLTCFICPAIVNPEQYGIISDAPINEVARFNLMQVGQLLQQLAMADADDGDPRRKSSLSKFDKSCVAAFLDVVIGGRAVETPPMSSLNLLEGLTRTVVYITHNQLLGLVDFVRSVTAGDLLREEDQVALETLLANVPSSSTVKSNSLELTPSNTPQLSPATTPANKKNRLPIASRSRSRSNIAQEGEPEASSQESLQEVPPEEVLVISLGTSQQTIPGMMSENEVLTLQLSDGATGGAPTDESKLHGKPDKTLRFSLCSDNLEGASEGLTMSCTGPSNRSNSVSSLDLEAESVSELGPGQSGSNGAEALQLLEQEQVTTQDNLDDKLRKFEIRAMIAFTNDRDNSETVSETWSTDVLGSDFDPNVEEDRLQDLAGATVDNMLGSLLCLPSSGSVLLDTYGSTISEMTSEAWSVEVLPSDSEAPDLKQEERLQELESCSGVGSTSDDTEVREVSSRPSTPGLSVVSGISATSEDIPNKIEDLRSECSSDFGGKDSVTSPDGEESSHGANSLTGGPSQTDSLLAMFDPLSSGEGNLRPKVHHPRPNHPPPDPPIPEACAMGPSEPRPPLFPLLPELEQSKQRNSFPERLVRSRSTDIVCSGRRPTSDPGLIRRTVAEDLESAGVFSTGPTSSPSKISLKGDSDERKDSDDEKSDRNKPWWKKRFVPAIPKAQMSAFRKRDKEKDDMGSERVSAGLLLLSQAAEDILEKYRNIKRPSPNEGTASGSYEGPDPIGDGESIQDSPRDDALQNISTDDLPDSASQTAQPPGSKFSFRLGDAKKKLRLALCSADSIVFPVMSTCARNGLPDHTDPEDNEIVCFLTVQLAEAINLQDKNQMAQIQETMRCVSHYDSRSCRKLLAAIAEDYRKRAPYIAYLTRCRQGLQTSQAHLERLLQRVLRDKEVANRYFTTVCVRLLLEHMESKMLDFITAFQGFTAADDKTAAVEDFLRYLYGAMAHDAIWQYASEEQLQDDGDILRDQVLQEHIQRLSKVVTANHKALQIPEVYLKEAPWPSAQAEIRTISAYKTPRDKVQCILRMCSTIMNLLSLANDDSVPGADDFVPVLVFVLIKANPPCLLSTIQYINNFYASRLSGEECYWWMQFTAAVEFIKTIDDRK